MGRFTTFKTLLGKSVTSDEFIAFKNEFAENTDSATQKASDYYFDQHGVGVSINNDVVSQIILTINANDSLGYKGDLCNDIVQDDLLPTVVSKTPVPPALVEVSRSGMKCETLVHFHDSHHLIFAFEEPTQRISAISISISSLSSLSTELQSDVIKQYPAFSSVLEKATSQAIQVGHYRVGSEHLLIAAFGEALKSSMVLPAQIQVDQIIEKLNATISGNWHQQPSTIQVSEEALLILELAHRRTLSTATQQSVERSVLCSILQRPSCLAFHLLKALNVDTEALLSSLTGGQ